MKKLVVFIVLLFNLVPYLEKGELHIAGPEKTFAQYTGGSEQNEDMCDEGVAGDYPSICEEATCDEGAVSYDVDECDGQVCDPTSVNYNPAECQIERCDHDNVNYDRVKCIMSKCDPNSPNYDPEQCGVCSAIPTGTTEQDATGSEPVTNDPCEWG